MDLFFRIGTFVVLIAAAPIAGQIPATSKENRKATTKTSTQTWAAPRTAEGRPDLQGVWNFATLTPLERPSELGGKQVFSNEEAAEYEKQTLERRNPDRRDGAKVADVDRAYNAAWWDFGTRIVGTGRTWAVATYARTTCTRL
jgi:hypothetical protein